MAIDPFIEYTGTAPDDNSEPVLEAQASAGLEIWLRDHTKVAAAITEAIRADVHLKELEGRTREAEREEQAAEEHDAMLLTRHDPAGHRILGFTAGAALVTLLVVLDFIPLNWAAQAFELAAAGTWLVTLILVVASICAMLGFELSNEHARKRRLLAVVVTLAYLALLGLRSAFLTTVSRESFPFALFQSAILTAISAGLVLCGSAVLARTRTLSLSRSRAAASRARRTASEARAAQGVAADRLRRHIGGLRQMLLPWALSSAAPTGVDRAAWAAAMERTVRRLFPAA
jgi:hypothetical protein